MSQWNRWKNIMKAYPFEKKRLAKWTPPYIIQPKYDGIRCRAVSTPTGYILLSSEENLIWSVPNINEACNDTFDGQEMDGELYCHRMKFEDIVSITSRTVNIHPDYKMIQFHIFDVINDQPQPDRLTFIEKFKDIDPFIKVSPFWLANNLEQTFEIYNRLINQDYEGIIVRNVDNYYERKRSTNIMKFKPKQKDFYFIVGFEEEISISGQPKNSLGSLICRSEDGNTFNVGTGFTNEQRKKLWENRKHLIGSICEVSYQHKTSGKKVPRFPVFCKVI